MRLSKRPTRYRFYNARTQRPVAEDDRPEDKNKDDATADKGDAPRKNLDQNNGGYGRETGFNDKD